MESKKTNLEEQTQKEEKSVIPSQEAEEFGGERIKKHKSRDKDRSREKRSHRSKSRDKSKRRKHKKRHHRDRSKDRKHRKKHRRDKDKHKKRSSKSKSNSWGLKSKESERSRTRSPLRNKRKHKKHKRHSKSGSGSRKKYSDSRRRSSKGREKTQRQDKGDYLQSYRKDDKHDRRRGDRGDRRDRDRRRSPPRQSNRRRKRFNFDSPPKQNPLASGLGRGESLQILQQLQMIPGMQNMSPADLMKLIQSQNVYNRMQSSRADRKLYIGNLPKNITPLTLVEVLNQALKKMGINTVPEGNSILSSWISADGNYAFVEFRTPEEASNGFALNNVSLFGQPLKVGRPRTYTAQQNNEVSPIQQLLAGLGNSGSLNTLLNGSETKQVTKEEEDKIKNTKTQVQLPTRVLVLKNMIKIPELEIDEEYQDILQDIQQQCQNYGKVLKIMIPRPQSQKHVPGLGKVFIMYENVEQAQKARAELTKMQFDNQAVEGNYLDEVAFEKGDFDVFDVAK